MKQLVYFVTFRYLKKSKKSRSAAFISRISIVGVAIGVMTLIVALSIMNGFENDLKKALIGTNAHLTLTAFAIDGEQKIENSQEIIEAIKKTIKAEQISPYSLDQALLSSQNKPRGILIKGVNPKIEAQGKQIYFLIRKNLYNKNEIDSAQHSVEVQQILDNLKIKPRAIKNGEIENLAGIVVGVALAKNLDLKLGDNLNILSTKQKISPFGQLPQVRKFIIVGFFESGLSTYDEVFTLVDIKEAAKTFRLENYIKGYSIYLPSLEAVPKEQIKLIKKFPFPYLVSSWIDDNYNLFAVLRLERIGLTLILFLIILVASFNILSSLIILVSEKSKDISILKAMGADNRSIRNIFILQGSIIGLYGSGIGSLLGLLICWFLKHFSVLKLPQGVYVTDKIPILIDWTQITLILIFSFLSCFLVTIFPAQKAANKNPIDGLRYE